MNTLMLATPAQDNDGKEFTFYYEMQYPRLSWVTPQVVKLIGPLIPGELYHLEQLTRQYPNAIIWQRALQAAKINEARTIQYLEKCLATASSS